MKIRAKNVKAKIGKHEPDFKKKKARVGKKVSRGNITAIKVDSKRIIVPLQSINTSSDRVDGDEKVYLDKILHQLHHYSAPNRTNALRELKKYVETSKGAQSHIAMIVPQVMELVYDDENETRAACVSTLRVAFYKFATPYFEATSSIIITYICSGLTSLSKGIRRDSLSVLLCVAECHPSILSPHFEKLISYVLSLVISPSKSGGQELLTTNKDRVNASSSTNDNKSTSATTGAATATSSKPKINTLVSSLQVLLAILSSSTNQQYVDSSNSQCASTNNGAYGILFVKSRYHTSRFLSNKRNKVSTAHNVETASSESSKANGTIEKCTFSRALAIQLCSRLSDVWNGLLAIDSSIVTADITEILKIIVGIVSILCTAFHLEDIAECKLLVANMFQYFPHQSYEASIAAPRSNKELESTINVTLLNVSICDVILSHNLVASHNPAGSNSIHRQTACSYVFNQLDIFIEVEEGRLTADASSKAQSLIDRPCPHAALISKLFTIMQAMILSDLTQLDRARAIGAEVGNDSINSFQSLLDAVNKIVSITATSQITNHSTSKSITTSMIKCICSITTADTFIHYSASDRVLASLAVFLSKTIRMLIDCSAEMMFLSDTVFCTITTLLQRYSSSYDSSIFTTLADSILLLFKQQSTSNTVPDGKKADGSSSSFYVKSSVAVRYRLLDVVYHCPFQSYGAASQLVLKCISHCSITSSEQSYLLRLLFERRQEIDVLEYIDSLLSSLDTYRKSLKLRLLFKATTKVNAENMLKVVVRHSKQWYAHDVCNAIMWSSSPEAPAKILKVLLPRVAAMMKPSDNWLESYLSLMTAATFLCKLSDTYCGSVSNAEGDEALIVRDDHDTYMKAIDIILDIVYRIVTDVDTIPTEYLTGGTDRITGYVVSGASHAQILHPIVTLIAIDAASATGTKCNESVFDRLISRIDSGWDDSCMTHERKVRVLRVIYSVCKYIAFHGVGVSTHKVTLLLEHARRTSADVAALTVHLDEYKDMYW